MRRLPTALLALAATVGLGLTACTSDEDAGAEPTTQDPPVSAFQDGACRVSAQVVLDVGARVRELAEEPPEPELLQQLADGQTALRSLPEAQELIAGIAFVRLRTASGTWTSDLGDSVRVSHQGLVAACTAPAVTPTATPIPSAS